MRSAEALGAHGLVLPQRRNAGLTGSVAKVAAGALEHLPVARVVNLNRSIEQLKDEGYRVVGLAEEGNVSLIEADLDGPLVVVTGSEAEGLSMLTRKHCDQLIRIPLRGATPSLNASVATALLLYEIARRGWMKTISGNAPAPRLVRPQVPATAAASSSPALDPLGAGGRQSDANQARDRCPSGPARRPQAEIRTPRADEPRGRADSSRPTAPACDPAPEASAGEIQEPIEAGIGLRSGVRRTHRLTPELIQDESSAGCSRATPLPELDLRVSLPEAIELGFTPATGSPFQGDIRL